MMRLTLRHKIILNLALLLLVNIIFAQSQVQVRDTIDLEEVAVYHIRSVVGSRPGLKSFTVDSLIIGEKKGQTLSELLLENSPIFIKTYGRGSMATASFRGTGASHTQVMWNGVRVNSPMSGEVDFSLIPLYFVDDVSIHFGQSSMGFGSGGLGGLVNLETQPDWEKEKGVVVFQSIGNYGTFSTAAIANYGKGSIKAKTRVFRESSQNKFSYRNKATHGHPIEVQQNADYLRMGILQELYYRPNPKSIFSSKTWIQDGERGIPKLMSSFAFDEENRQYDKNFNSVAQWQYYGERAKLNLSTSLSALDLKYVHSKTSSEGNELPVLNAESKSVSWFVKAGAETDLNPWISLKLDSEYGYDVVETHERILGTGYWGNQHQIGIRSMLTANPIERLSVSLLLNQEVYNKHTSPLMHSISAEYRFLEDESLAIKAATARNYHFPSLNALHMQPGGSPDLKPEKGMTWEGGMAYRGKPDSQKINFDLTLFSSDIENWIMWLPHLKGYWEPINLKHVKAKGAEVNLSSSLAIEEVTILIQGNYSITRSSIENAGGVIRPDSHGKQLPFIPVHSGGFYLTSVWRGYKLSYTFTHFSERFTTTSNNPNSFRKLYPYYMSSATIGKDFRFNQTNWGFLLKVDNLLNESYQTILWRPMPGRNYSLVLRIEV